MSVEAIFAVLKERNLRLAFGADGKLVFRGQVSEVTDALKDAVKIYKDEIVPLLASQGITPQSVLSQPAPVVRPAREFAWHTGHRYTQTPDDPRYDMEEFSPGGAWWWRWQGETEWRAVPDRGGENCSLIEGRQPA